MRTPWYNKTGLAKLATVFATLLILSLGLCGANFALFRLFASIDGGGQVPERVVLATNTLMTTGFFELLGIATGIGGLLITAALAIGKLLVRKSETKD
jgi:hypothetical protein